MFRSTQLALRFRQTIPRTKLLRPRGPALYPRFQSTSTVTAATAPVEPHHPPPKLLPEEIVAPELEHLKQQIQFLCSSTIPGLDLTAKHYLQRTGKLFRSMVVLLMSRATAIAPKAAGWEPASETMKASLNSPIAPSEVLRDLNPHLAALSSWTIPVDIPGSDGVAEVLGTQRRLAEIVELIHTASLLHDDVIDTASTRRGAPSANVLCGNKLSVLAGDYMLSRASVYLARLRNLEVVELLADVIAELIMGELYQLQNTSIDHRSRDYLQKSLDYYLEKTYLKTASLISKSCRAAAVLGGATPEVAEASYVYGKHLGLAFQLVDDLLDFTADEEKIGKAANADLKLGLATAPVFYAWEEFPELGEMIARRFCWPGDAEKVFPPSFPTSHKTQ